MNIGAQVGRPPKARACRDFDINTKPLGAEKTMGKLVRFTKNQRFISTQSDEKHEAQLLLFTGVRYERTPETKNRKNSATAKRKRKRG